jgi:hypothetical protein
LIEIKPNIYIIKASHGFVIDVDGAKYKNEAKLTLYPQHSGDNQLWVL